MATDKPALDAETWERIESTKYSVKKSYAEKLSPYLQDLPPIFDLMREIPDGLGSPPKQPITLCKILAEYATALFNVEWSHYPQNDELPIWLRNLAQRVERDVIAHALNLGHRAVGLTSRFTIGLTYHASEHEMREAVREGLKFRVVGLKSRSVAQITTQPILQSTQRAAIQPPKPKTEHSLPPTKKKRMPSTITSPLAARRMEYFLNAKGIGQTEFASVLKVTDRNLRAFRATGKIKRGTFDEIAAKMGTTREQLIDPASGIPS
jgi:hypothetical protein